MKEEHVAEQVALVVLIAAASIYFLIRSASAVTGIFAMDLTTKQHESSVDTPTATFDIIATFKNLSSSSLTQEAYITDNGAEIYSEFLSLEPDEIVSLTIQRELSTNDEVCAGVKR